jgi:hypothetical protein
VSSGPDRCRRGARCTAVWRTLDEVEGLVAGVLAQHVADQVAEQSDVVADVVGGGRCVGWPDRSWSDSLHAVANVALRVHGAFTRRR